MEGIEVGEKLGWLYKDDLRHPCGDGNILYHECVKVNILVVVGHYCFARCCRWNDLGTLYLPS